MNDLCTTATLDDARAVELDIEMVSPMPGFPQARRFSLERLPERYQPFALLRCGDVEGLEFVVVPPGLVVEGYSVEIDDVGTDRLGLGRADDAIVLGIVTLGETPSVNLLGPIVVNSATGAAMQVVLPHSPFGARHPLG